MATLTDTQIREGLASLPGWKRSGEAIERVFTFESFPDAVAFLVRLAFDAEGADHHPDVAISYRKVTLRYSTHSEGGVTASDLDGARTVDRLYSSLGSRAGRARN